jgi:Asp-tRNA(Asn)/Glu-tRNA(Gln) amidotransferase A subunit family amidase
MTDLLTLEAAELLDAYRAGGTTPVEVLAAVRARIAAVNPVLNSVITVIGDRVDLAAEESTRRWRAEGTVETQRYRLGVRAGFGKINSRCS